MGSRNGEVGGERKGREGRGCGPALGLGSEDECSYEYNPYSSLEIYLHGGVSPGGVRLAQIIASVRSEEVRTSIDWRRVRREAEEVVGRLVAQIPELNEMSRLPLCPAKPADVLPIGFFRLKIVDLPQKDGPRETARRSLVSHDDPPHQDEKRKLAMLNQFSDVSTTENSQVSHAQDG
ncbi:hypothetical protein EJB05_38303, partial [Eragrostis curvula]